MHVKRDVVSVSDMTLLFHSFSRRIEPSDDTAQVPLLLQLWQPLASAPPTTTSAAAEGQGARNVGKLGLLGSVRDVQCYCGVAREDEVNGEMLDELVVGFIET